MKSREVDPGWREGALSAAQGVAFLDLACEVCQVFEAIPWGWAGTQAADERTLLLVSLLLPGACVSLVLAQSCGAK